MLLLARHLNTNGLKFANSSIANQFRGEAAIAVGPFVASTLQYPTGLPRRIANRPALSDRVGKRFFTVNVFATPHCVDRSNRMPMIGSRNVDGIDIAALYQFAKIFKSCTILVSIVLVDFLGGGFQMVLINITGGDKLDPRVFEKLVGVVATLTATTDRSHHDPITWRDRTAQPQ